MKKESKIKFERNTNIERNKIALIKMKKNRWRPSKSKANFFNKQSYNINSQRGSRGLGSSRKDREKNIERHLMSEIERIELVKQDLRKGTKNMSLTSDNFGEGRTGRVSSMHWVENNINGREFSNYKTNEYLLRERAFRNLPYRNQVVTKKYGNFFPKTVSANRRSMVKLN